MDSTLGSHSDSDNSSQDHPHKTLYEDGPLPCFSTTLLPLTEVSNSKDKRAAVENELPQSNLTNPIAFIEELQNGNASPDESSLDNGVDDQEDSEDDRATTAVLSVCGGALDLADALTCIPTKSELALMPTSESHQTPISSPSAHLLQLALHLPRLVRTATLGTLGAARAVASHVLCGPPHDSWNLLTTATRGALRAVMLANAPAGGKPALNFVRGATAFTFPTAPHLVRYTPVLWVTGNHELDLGEKQYRNQWRQTQVVTEVGQAAGHHLTGEFVVPIGNGKQINEPKTLVIYVHGGAFHFLSARTHRCITAKFARSAPHCAVLGT
jgi:hypothetical protein